AAVLVRDHAGAVGVREHEIVVAGQKADRRGGVPGRERSTRQVEQLATALVAEGAERPERLERRLEVAYAEPAPLGDVRPGRRPEGSEVTADEALAGRQRIDLLVVDQDVARLARLLPGSRGGRVGDAADGAQRVPESRPAVVLDPVRLAEPGEDLGPGTRLSAELEQGVVDGVGDSSGLGADPRRQRDRRAEH